MKETTEYAARAVHFTQKEIDLYKEVLDDIIYAMRKSWDCAISVSMPGLRFRGRFADCQAFFEADLRNADFSEAELDNCGFSGANLRGANMVGGKFCDCDFTGADLRGAMLPVGFPDSTGMKTDGVQWISEEPGDGEREYYKVQKHMDAHGVHCLFPRRHMLNTLLARGFRVTLEQVESIVEGACLGNMPAWLYAPGAQAAFSATQCSADSYALLLCFEPGNGAPRG